MKALVTSTAVHSPAVVLATMSAASVSVISISRALRYWCTKVPVTSRCCSGVGKSEMMYSFGIESRIAARLAAAVSCQFFAPI